MTPFQGQVAVVTGASSGIGKAVALSLAEHGATVCLVARRLKELETIASSSRATLSELRPYQTDLSKREDLDRLITRLRTDFQQCCSQTRRSVALHRCGSWHFSIIGGFGVLVRGYTNIDAKGVWFGFTIAQSAATCT